MEILNEDRGTVKRVTFDIVYPNGQLKTVVMENTSEELIGSFRALLFDKQAIESYFSGTNSGPTSIDDAKNMWSEVQGDPKKDYPPAMIFVNGDDQAIALCGAHRSRYSAEIRIK